MTEAEGAADRRIACVDVDYRDDRAVAAALLFSGWSDAGPSSEHIAVIEDPAPYEPGAFFRRELPCLRAVLEPLAGSLRTVVIDGYVWLSADRAPGLGAHLFEAFGGEIAVIGVAKSRFEAAPAVEVRRGGSDRPLYVTSAGVDVEAAARAIAAMHGPHRLPTLLKAVDRLARDRDPPPR